MNKKGKIIAFILCLSFIGLLLINPIEIYINQVKIYQKRILKANTLLYSKPTSKPDTSIKKENIKDEINNSIRISYVGDLILLKDQVIAAKIISQENTNLMKCFNILQNIFMELYYYMQITIGFVKYANHKKQKMNLNIIALYVILKFV